MADALSRELILPAIRLDVPPRPTDQQVAVLAERLADQWTPDAREWTTQQVVRLAVAEVLRSRLAQAPASRLEALHLSADPAVVTLEQLVALFRPHVGLAGQAFALGVLGAVNAGVPAAVDPLRDGLRRLGLTGRDPVKVVALGSERIPARARQEFWNGVRQSTALTAVVDSVVSGGRSRQRPSDISGLDRSELARADALVLGAGAATPVNFGSRQRDGGSSWLSVPVRVTRQARGRAAEPERGRGGEAGVDVGLRPAGWTEVFETALDAVGTAMTWIDTGNRPKGGRGGQHLAATIAQRLVAARARTVDDVCTSLRALDPLALEMFDHQVTTTSVPTSVPVVDDDAFVQLWLPTSALAGPLFIGSADLVVGDGAEVRTTGSSGSGGGTPRGSGASSERGRPRQGGAGQQGQPGPGGGSRRRGGKSRDGRPRGERPAPADKPTEKPAEAPVERPAAEAPVAPPVAPTEAPSQEG